MTFLHGDRQQKKVQWNAAELAGEGLGGAGPFQESVVLVGLFFFVQLGLFVKTAHNTSYLATYEVGSATRVLLALSAFTSRGRTGTKSLPTHKGAKGNANEPFYTSTGYLYTTTSPTVRPL